MPIPRQIILYKSKSFFNHYFEGKIALFLGMVNLAQNFSIYIGKFW